MTDKQFLREKEKSEVQDERRQREKDAVRHGKDPLLEKSVQEILQDLPKRLLLMVSKLFGIKGFILGATAALSIFDVFGSYAWLVWVIISVFVIFGREGLKAIRDFKNL
jgi:hypothetical protein